MAKKNGILVKGIPIKARWKYLIMGIFLFLLVLNVVLPQYIDALNYPGQGWVSVILIIGAVIISIGSYTTETIIIAIVLVGIVSNFWDFGVHDFSLLRRQIMLWSIGILIFELTFGKVGLIHLVRTLKSQFGVSGR